jgi:hypothetical protein
MSDEKKPKALATAAAGRIPGMNRANLAATVRAKAEGKKVAYAFIVCAVDEIMRAMDIVPAWGESFAGICAAKRDAEKYLQRAEGENFSRSLCTYATCSLGFDIWREELGGEMPPNPPWGGIGRPDMILGSGQLLCDPRYKWPQATRHFLRDVPVHVGGMYYPPWDPAMDHKEQEAFYVRYNTRELHACVRFCEKVTGRKMDWDRLAQIVDLSDRTWNLFIESYELRKAAPCPMDTRDAMNTMVPISFMLGTRECHDFYRDLKDELTQKIARGEGVVEDEIVPAPWGAGLPSWFALADFDYFHTKGAVFPVETTLPVQRGRRPARFAEDRRPPGAHRLEMGALLDALVRQGEAARRIDTRGGAPRRIYRGLPVRRRGLPLRLLVPLVACGHHAPGRDAEEDLPRHAHPYHGRRHRRYRLVQRGGYASPHRCLYRGAGDGEAQRGLVPCQTSIVGRYRQSFNFVIVLSLRP